MMASGMHRHPFEGRHLVLCLFECLLDEWVGVSSKLTLKFIPQTNKKIHP